MVYQSSDGGRSKITAGIRQRAALAEWLAAARRQRGLSQAALGVHLSYVSGMETGREVPNVAMLRKLAGYADGVEAADEAAADGRWVRRMVETYPASANRMQGRVRE